MSHALLSQRFAIAEMEQQLQGRFQVVFAGFDMLKENVALGMGFEGFYDNYGKYMPGVPKSMKYSPHNIFIDALTNYGLIGFPLFLLIFIIPLRSAISVILKGQKDSDFSLNASMCFATFIPFMIAGFWAGGLFVAKPVMYLLYTYCAFFLSGDNHSSMKIMIHHDRGALFKTTSNG